MPTGSSQQDSSKQISPKKYFVLLLWGKYVWSTDEEKYPWNSMAAESQKGIMIMNWSWKFFTLFFHTALALKSPPKKPSNKNWLLMQKRWGENMCLLHYSKHTSVRDLLGSPTHHHSLIIMLKWACNYLPNPNCWQRSASLASGTLFGQISSDP